MGLYRSEIMKLYQLTVPKDDAQSVMNEFGDIGFAHFVDLNAEESPYNLPYTAVIKQCEDTERKLAYLLRECERHFVRVTPPENIDTFLQQLKIISDNKRKAVNLLFEEIQKDITKQEAFIQTQTSQMKEAEHSLQGLTDSLQVFKVAQEMIPELENRRGEQGGDMDGEEGALMGNGMESNLTKIAGVVEKTEIERLRRLIFRATRGKSIMFVQDCEEDEDLDTAPRRAVYIIMYWDGQTIRDRIEKICDSFSGQRFPLPDGEIGPEIERATNAIKDARSVLDETRKSVRDQLLQFDKIEGADEEGQENTNISTIYIYKMFLAKERALYQTLNMMKWQAQTFTGYFWAPVDEQNFISQRLQSYNAVRISPYEEHTIAPPTYIKTNEFTGVYQLIVDTYGVPRYLEANPAVLTIATFPFFFGMMFGDMGHGSVLFLVGATLVLGAESFRGTLPSGILAARYLLLLMGLMATYAGFIYNEYFAITTNFFGSCYGMNQVESVEAMEAKQLQNGTVVTSETNDFIWRRGSNKCVYPFGQDPVWGQAENKLSFVNSIKMKMSVIFGVLHMSFGIFCKGTNTIYFRRLSEFWTEVIAGLIILWGLFGWMDALIVAKFFKTYDIDNCPAKAYSSDQIRMLENEQELQEPATCQGDLDNRKTPGIINIMITTVFAFGNYDEEKHQDAIIGKDEKQQYGIAVALLIIAFVFIPIMLFVKPCIVLCTSKPEEEEEEKMIEAPETINEEDEKPEMMMMMEDGMDNEGGNASEESILMEGGDGEMMMMMMEGGDDKEGKQLAAKREGEMKSIDQQLKEMGEDSHGQTFGEVFIHQMIETIEFVLGTVSNTASYLRLWALSLAHTELADTFLKLCFAYAFQGKSVGSTIGLSCLFWPVLWTVTFGVLMSMDLLECFLHTLRLHWVEFQNKFYKGDGYRFKPYSFTTILNDVLAD